jgi:hypothetical protein
MNKILLLTMVVLLLVVAAAAAFYFTAAPPRRSIRLDLTGTEGMGVTGEYIVDGVKHPIDGKLPLSFETTGANFDYIVRMPEDGGELQGELFIDGEREGSSAAHAPPFAGVRGEYKTTAFSMSQGFTVVRQGE